MHGVYLNVGTVTVISWHGNFDMMQVDIEFVKLKLKNYSWSDDVQLSLRDVKPTLNKLHSLSW